MHTFVDRTTLPAASLNDNFADLAGGSADVDANSLVIARRDAFANHVISGLTLPTSSANLNITLAAGIIMVDGYYLAVSSQVITVSASKDTYIDVKVNSDGTYSIVAVPVANGATTGMNITTNFDSTRAHRIAKIVSGASTISSVVQYGIDPLGNRIYNVNPLSTDIVYFASLQNSWVDFDATIYGQAQYYKTKSGIVYVDGLIKNGVTTNGTTLFTLPVGFRPMQQQIFAAIAGNALCRMDVFPTGVVQVAVGASASYMSFNTIRFTATGQ